MFIKNFNTESGLVKLGFGQVKHQAEKTGEAKDLKNGTVFAGDLTVIPDKISQNKELAHKKALKVIMDTFGRDLDIGKGQAESRMRIGELKETVQSAREEREKIIELKSNLAEEYQVEEGSEEQQNLELLRKQRELLGGKEGNLTEEEKKRLADMGPLTEYQKQALEYDDMEQVWQKRLETAENGIQAETAFIIAVDLALLKKDPMVDAGKQADEILKASSEAIIGMLTNEAVKQTDEEREEKIEESEKKAESLQEKNEQPPSSSESDKTDNTAEIMSKQGKLQHDLKVMVENQEFIEEDLKGILMDRLL